jgi:hypothetical protein
LVLRMGVDETARAMLARRLDRMTEEVRRQHGDGAFKVTREMVAHHEAGHAVIGACEGLAVTRLELFRKPMPGLSAGSCLPGFRLGQYFVDRRHKVDAHSDAIADLKEARIIIAGRAAEMLSPHGRPGAALDELTLSQTIAELAARKLRVDAEELFECGVWRPALAACRLNRATINRIARRLLGRGVVDGSRLQALLRGVKRLVGIYCDDRSAR